jgi:hypothetical protein
LRNQWLIDLDAESADRRRSVRQSPRTNTLCVRFGLSFKQDSHSRNCRVPNRRSCRSGRIRDGKPLHLLNYGGYQTPPLDGVWATAPYFHNGSVPTIAGVLESKSRPSIYTRSFSTEKDAYDQQRVG